MTLPVPTGECFCGCGSAAAPGAFFKQGHDKKAESDLNAIHHGNSVVARLVSLGYGPGGMNLQQRAIELGVRERCGIDGCNVSGIPNSRWLRQHQAEHHLGKYRPLVLWLSQQDESEIGVTFGEIEEILGFSLPPSCRTHEAHWYGYEGTAVGRAIRDSGWKASTVKLDKERVTLVRAAVSSPESPSLRTREELHRRSD